jgi:hypothetical protein
MKGINQSNGNHLKFLYGVTSTDRLIQHEHADKFIDSCIKILAAFIKCPGLLSGWWTIN